MHVKEKHEAGGVRSAAHQVGSVLRSASATATVGYRGCCDVRWWVVVRRRSEGEVVGLRRGCGQAKAELKRLDECQFPPTAMT
jgi:hypothetical protein